MNRRGLVGALAAAAALAVVPKKTRAETKRKLRPPGALPRGTFEQACIGCFRCAEVCPTKVIRFPSGLSLDVATPYLDFDDRACVLCMKCTHVCPTDALVPLAADADVVAREVRLGVPKLERSACLPWTGRGICRLCYQVCPYPDRAVEVVGPQKAPLFHPEACVGCGLCEEACPETARAIVIEPLP
ncbi:4Fe-4S dicluster domain-containing protein [Myxococcus sp. RHSTA-1-4]|uniref:4Fe-4S dicluster domain-containing protein n=1 Tax=Myxococcus sp. RHSTA-1-4 TaxID=2874601 RepID=UPI001CBD64FB|nr:4Fe-4S dicluster domain-containing protein [Myxococcus sp. RHSTA-1-4]MBZ4415241.1 4Fe-4S dicluster domain-containing protein [Myxococcus sp. RHSTA-1-4]